MRTAAGRGISLNEVASAVNMSANYFSAIFQSEDAEDVCGISDWKKNGAGEEAPARNG